jgi:hypothetical protein
MQQQVEKRIHPVITIQCNLLDSADLTLQLQTDKPIYG